MDSNHRPHDYQSCALASWAIGPYLVDTSSIFLASALIRSGQVESSLIALLLLSNSNPLALGFEFVKRTAFVACSAFQSTLIEKSKLVLYYSWIMQAHSGFCFAKIVFLPWLNFNASVKHFPLLLPSHNCIIIHNVQFSRCIWVSRNSMKYLLPKTLQSISLLLHFSLLLLTLRSGGPKWTRTIDLTIISRVL